MKRKLPMINITAWRSLVVVRIRKAVECALGWKALVHYVIRKAIAYRGYAVTGTQWSFSLLKPSVERFQKERGEKENRRQLSEVSGGSIRRVGLTLPFTNTRYVSLVV